MIQIKLLSLQKYLAPPSLLRELLVIRGTLIIRGRSDLVGGILLCKSAKKLSYDIS